MTWVSLVCLLALSSSAFGRAAYSYSAVAPTTMRDTVTQQRPILPTNQMQSNYGQQQQLPQQISDFTSSSSYGGQSLPQTQQIFGQQHLLQADRTADLSQSYGSSQQAATFPVRGYGAAPTNYAPQQFDQQQPQQQIVQQIILTEADIMCRGQRAETVIPLEEGRRFVVCLDESKGVEQACPKGLWYHQPSRRCERKMGPLENQCASQPCLNGGQCVPTEFSYQCQCAPGFDGKTCELDARVCQEQQPCGQSPDSRCQSFRWGAALTHMCILQDGLAYGLTAQQPQQSPCQGVDGPQALAVSNKGFIMCDGERMFVESCPGGTIWDDSNKACVWPDMQGVIASPQFDQQQQQPSYGQQSSYSQQSYGQTPTITHHSRSMIHKPKHHMRHHQHDQSKLVQQYGQAPAQSYGAQIVQRPQLDLGLIQQQSGYGAPQHQTQQDLTQRSGYGAPQQQTQQDLTQRSGYGAQTIVQRPQQDLSLLQPQPQQQSGYGAQTTVQRPQFDLNLLQPQQSTYGGAQVQQKSINWQQPQQDIVQVKQSSGY